MKKQFGWMLERTRTYCTIKVYFINAYKSELFWNTLKPWYSEQAHQTLFVHYIEKFSTLSNVIYLVNTQNGSWVLLTILQSSLYRGSLYRGLKFEKAVFWQVVLKSDVNTYEYVLMSFMYPYLTYFLKSKSFKKHGAMKIIPRL